MHPRLANATLALAIIFILAIGAPQFARAQNFAVLYTFSGGTDGGNPAANLILDRAGNLYGTTIQGGDLACRHNSSGCGVVFTLDTAGKEIVLLTFHRGGQGRFPGSLVRDSAGSLYGVTLEGGGQNSGTLFKLTGGQERVLHSFKGGASDGASPDYLLRDPAGNLYGAAAAGGSGGAGTIFTVHDSHETTVYNFTGGADGQSPVGLTLGAAGSLYGTAFWGGSKSCNAGCGVIFKLDKSGGGFAVLHSFSGRDGANPSGSLVRDKAGNLYGATGFGGGTGCNGFGCGTVFKLSSTGKLTVLHRFSGTDGAAPTGSIVRDAAGALYGTTSFGGGTGCGGFGCGVVFRVDKTGALTVLHSFSGGADGANPQVGLTRDSAGNLYGTTGYGGGTGCGGSGCGVVFKIAP